MMHFVRFIAGIAALVASVQAATLERLTLDQMIHKSTAIVRGRVLGSRSAFRGPIIYTYFTVQVVEGWKGPESPQIEVAVPGGTANGLHQSFSGAPRLASGNEYILFLWTGSSGLTQIIGFSQGVFSLNRNAGGGIVASRAASTEAMLDSKTGRVVADASLRVGLSELRARVNSTVGGTARK